MPDPQTPQRRPPPPLLSDFPLQTYDVVRFGDTDLNGHINNAVFATFFESGRVAMIRKPEIGLNVPGAGFVVARQEIDYLREMHWPGRVDIGTGVARIGRTSFSVAQALFKDGTCTATGRTTLVLIDLATRSATALPDDLKARMQTLALPVEPG